MNIFGTPWCAGECNLRVNRRRPRGPIRCTIKFLLSLSLSLSQLCTLTNRPAWGWMVVDADGVQSASVSLSRVFLFKKQSLATLDAWVLGLLVGRLDFRLGTDRRGKGRQANKYSLCPDNKSTLCRPDGPENKRTVLYQFPQVRRKNIIANIFPPNSLEQPWSWLRENQESRTACRAFNRFGDRRARHF